MHLRSNPGTCVSESKEPNKTRDETTPPSVGIALKYMAVDQFI